MATMKPDIGKSSVGAFLASPASTAAGWESHAPSSDADDVEYQCVSAAPSPATGPATAPLLDKPISLSAGSPSASRSYVCALASAIGLIGLLLCAFLAAGGVTISRQAPPPRIWNPDLRKEFSSEPVAKSVIRKFDAYNMARGGRDDGPTFTANVQQYLAPDLFYESVGFGNWHTPAGWARGEEHNYGMAFPETIFTQMLFFGDSSVATTTTYGSAFWAGDLMGLKAPKRWVNLRILDFYHLREERPGWSRVRYNFMMIDWADVLRQSGRPVLPPAPLPEGLVLPPAANDGVPAPLSVLVQTEGRDSEAARTIVERALLGDWAGDASDEGSAWDEDMTFYGPAGIGLARSRAEYQRHVLDPFRAAFANRTVVTQLSACEGNYCAILGRVHAHGVGSWLGLPTAGKQVALRFGMHWRVMGGKAKEGWAIFDYPGLFEQVGLSFEREAAARQPIV